MIKPSEVNLSAPADYNPAHLDELERQFDAAITKASRSGQWPAQVPIYRDAMTYRAIEEMCRRYTDLGWSATPGRGTTRATISPRVA